MWPWRSHLTSLIFHCSTNGSLPLLGVWVILNKFKINADKVMDNNYVKGSQEKPEYLGLCSLNPLRQVPEKPESSETGGSDLSLGITYSLKYLIPRVNLH